MNTLAQFAPSDDRFASMWAEVLESNELVLMDSPEMCSAQHNNWVWDARRLPTNGHYVPVFLDLIEELEKCEGISPQKNILVETTTGNAGTAAGYVANNRGYSLVLFMPEDMPAARIELVQSYLPDDGVSRLILTPKKTYVKGMVRELRKFLVANRGGYFGKNLVSLNHSRRDSAPKSIQKVIANAIQRAGLDSIDIAVAALGNGTASTALYNATRDVNPNVMTVGIEPEEAPTSFIKKYGKKVFEEKFHHTPEFHSHGLIGSGGWGVEFPHLHIDAIDEIHLVKKEEWQQMEKILIKRGLNVGHTSTACQHIVKLLSGENKDKPLNFVSIIYDSGRSY